MRLALSALVGAALTCCGTPALAAPGDDIGATVRIVNLVTGAYAKDLRHLAKGDSVRQDELIEVGDDGIGEIRLNDDTELALGPGARLRLDQFVYDPDISGGAIVLNLARGAFRFITGIAAKPAYVIRTPTASVTVRGTIFDVYVQASGVAWLLLLEGAIEACSESDQCKELDEPGKLMRITPDGVVSDPARWADLPTADLPFETAFPFIVSPPEVDPDPAFSPEDIVGGNVPDGPPEDDDDEIDDARDTDDIVDDDTGPGPPDSGPPPRCWDGWKKVHKGWSADGWRVKHRRRGRHVIYCAHRVAPPDVGLPPKPRCAGGKTVLLKTLPPRWRCICPDGKKRHRLGKNAYVCKGRPVGDPRKECLKKGWRWTGKRCIEPDRRCPRGYIGKPPNCKKLTIKPCPKGTIGKWPNCRKIVKPPKRCKPGYVGKWPNCKKLTLKPKKTPKDFKKAIKKFQLQKKD